jgi:spore coat polysaccharide biosynthesis protein SpsF
MGADVQDAVTRNVGAVIVCRYDSSRLPGKILRQVRGRAILDWIWERTSSLVHAVVVATSTDPSDDPIAEHCARAGYPLIRGSKNDVADRFYRAAAALGVRYAARVSGDNLFGDAEGFCALADIAVNGEWDLVTNVTRPRITPAGLSTEIVHVARFGKLLERFDRPDHREHVTLWLYEHPDAVKMFVRPLVPPSPDLRFAIDTADDLAFAERLFATLGPPPPGMRWPTATLLEAAVHLHR